MAQNKRFNAGQLAGPIPHMECACAACRHRRWWISDVQEVLERTLAFFETSNAVRAPTLTRDIQRVANGYILGEGEHANAGGTQAVDGAGDNKAVPDPRLHQDMAHHEFAPRGRYLMG